MDTFALDHLRADRESVLCRGALSCVGRGLAAGGDAIVIWPGPGGLLGEEGSAQRREWGLPLPPQAPLCNF